MEDGPNREEPAGVPLEQLTFKLFLDHLDDEDDEEFGCSVISEYTQ